MWLLMTLLACEPENKDAMSGINTGGYDTESPDGLRSKIPER